MNRDQLRISQLVGDIAQLSVMINQHTDMYAFVRLSGHVSIMDVNLAPKRDYNEKITKDELYYDDSPHRSIESVIDKLTRLKMQLKKILIDNKVDLSGCSRTTREEYDYHLL